MAVLGPHWADGAPDLESLIMPIMQAEAKIFTSKQEAVRRKAKWSEEYPPLNAYPRLLGKRANGTYAYAFDVNLHDVTARDFHFEPGLVDTVTSATIYPPSPPARDIRPRAVMPSHTRAYTYYSYYYYSYTGRPEQCTLAREKRGYHTDGGSRDKGCV
jgi:hypothetical protein